MEKMNPFKVNVFKISTIFKKEKKLQKICKTLLLFLKIFLNVLL